MSPWTHANTFAFTYKLVWKYFDLCFQMRDLRLRVGNEFLKDSLMPDMVLKRKRELLWMELVRAGFVDVLGPSQTLVWWAGGEGT